MNFLNLNGDIAIRFGMPALRIKANSPILPILILKLVTMPTSLEPSGKGVKSAIYDQIPTIHVYVKISAKIGPLDPEFSLLKSLFKKRKELTQAEHI